MKTGSIRSIALIGTLQVAVFAQIAPPTFRSDGVVNAADAGPISPGALISVYGSNLASTEVKADRLPLPTTLGSVTIEVGDDTPVVKRLPLLYVSPTQINAQLPYDLKASSRIVMYVKNGASSNESVFVSVLPLCPGVFTHNMRGTGEAMLFHGNFTAVTQDNPAHAEETVIMYMTGLGQVTPAIQAGNPAGDGVTGPLHKTVESIGITVAGKNAVVAFSGLAPGMTGVYQVNFVVPQVDGYNHDIKVVSKSGTLPTSGSLTSFFVPAIWPPEVLPIITNATLIRGSIDGAHSCKDLQSGDVRRCRNALTFTSWIGTQSRQIQWSGSSFFIKDNRTIGGVGSSAVVSDYVEMFGELADAGRVMSQGVFKRSHSDSAMAGVILASGYRSESQDFSLEITSLPANRGILGPSTVVYTLSGEELRIAIKALSFKDTKITPSGQTHGEEFLSTDWSRATLTVTFSRP